jgi:hypothetical protein
MTVWDSGEQDLAEQDLALPDWGQPNSVPEARA